MDSQAVATTFICIAFAIFLLTFSIWVLVLSVKKSKKRKLVEKNIREEQEANINKKLLKKQNKSKIK